MIRQLCPHCYAAVELSPDSAGVETPCPKCGKAIAVPAAYAPSVAASGGLQNLGAAAPNLPIPTPSGTNPMSDPIAPPPGLNAPIPAPPPPLEPIPSFASATPGTASCGITFNPSWVDWVPVACFTLILVLTFLTWVGVYPGGVRIYSQTPWHALIGSVSPNTLPEDLLLEEKYFEENVTGNRWLIAYFPLLFVALLLSWLDRIIRNPTVTSVPGPLAWLPSIWPKRFMTLTVLSALMLALILIQTWRGYGLETAVHKKVADKHAEQLEKADVTPKKQKVYVAIGAELGAYQLQGTTPLNLAILAHAVALGALLVSSFLHHNRAGRPLPRLSLQY